MTPITYEEFEQVDVRSGTIVKVEEFKRAKNQRLKCGQILALTLASYKHLPKSRCTIHQKVLWASKLWGVLI